MEAGEDCDSSTMMKCIASAPCGTTRITRSWKNTKYDQFDKKIRLTDGRCYAASEIVSQIKNGEIPVLSDTHEEIPTSMAVRALNMMNELEMADNYSTKTKSKLKHKYPPVTHDPTPRERTPYVTPLASTPREHTPRERTPYVTPLASTPYYTPRSSHDAANSATPIIKPKLERVRYRESDTEPSPYTVTPLASPYVVASTFIKPKLERVQYRESETEPSPRGEHEWYQDIGDNDNLSDTADTESPDMQRPAASSLMNNMLTKHIPGLMGAAGHNAMDFARNLKMPRNTFVNPVRVPAADNVLRLNGTASTQCGVIIDSEAEEQPDGKTRPTKMMCFNTAELLPGLPDITDDRYSDQLTANCRNTPWLQHSIKQIAESQPGSLCALTDKRLHPQQAILHAHFTHMAHLIAKHPDDFRKRIPRGTVVYHNTGSGKTNVMMGIFDAFYNLVRNEGWDIYFVTDKGNVGSNGVENFAEWGKLYPNFLRMSTKHVIDKLARIKGNPAKGIVKKHNWLDYRIFSNSASSDAKVNNRRELQTSKIVLLLDEFHAAFQSNGKDENDATKFRKLYLNKLLQDDTKDVILVMLTATPGENIRQLQQIMSYTDWGNPTTNERNYMELADFAQHCRGKISYVDMRNVKGIFPRLTVVRVPIILDATDVNNKKTSHKQQYEKALKAAVKSERKSSKRGATYLEKARIAATLYDKSLGNMSCLCGTSGCPTGMDANKSPFSKDDLKRVSTRIESVLENINRHPNMKHFVYGRYKQEVNAVACALETQLGYSVVRPVVGKTLNAGEGNMLDTEATLKQARRITGPKYLRIYAEPSQTSYNARSWPGYIVKKMWNTPPDKEKGPLFTVLLGTDENLKGIDLKDTPIVHQIGEFESQLALTQFDGRSVRSRSMCGYAATVQAQVVTKYVYALKTQAEVGDESDNMDRSNIMAVLRVDLTILKLKEETENRRVHDLIVVYYQKMNAVLDELNRIRASGSGNQVDINELDAQHQQYLRDIKTLENEDGIRAIAAQWEKRHTLSVGQGRSTQQLLTDYERLTGDSSNNVDTLLLQRAKREWSILKKWYDKMQQNAFDSIALAAINGPLKLG